MPTTYIETYQKQFSYYKSLADTAIARLTAEQLMTVPSSETNAVATLMKHMAGNMLSRWTDIWTTDGEKEWRDRDDEFELREATAGEIAAYWEQGWECLFTTLASLTDEDLDKLIYIRNMGHTVQEAVVRQLCHYSYHVGQIIYAAKLYIGPAFESLSIPKGQSTVYNEAKFAKEKQKKHFTDDL